MSETDQQGPGPEELKRIKDKLLNDQRRDVNEKWKKTLTEENLAKIPGTKAYKELNAPGTTQERQSVNPADVVGSKVYMENSKPQSGDAWQERNQADVDRANNLVNRMKSKNR